MWGVDRHQRPLAPVNHGVQPGNSQFVDKLSGSDVLLAHTSALQRLDTLPWPSSQEYTQSMHPARKPTAVMPAEEVPPGSMDAPTPTRRPTGIQMDFQPRQTVPVGAQQVGYGDQSLPTRLSRATGAYTEPSMGRADQVPSADSTSRDMQSRP